MTGVDTRNTRLTNDFLINQSSAGVYTYAPATSGASAAQETVFSGATQPVRSANPECEDGQDDGHISLWSKLKNAAKGVGNFFKGLVCDENGNFSLGQTLKTVAIGVGVGALCVLTAGTAVPAIVATAGIAMSGYGLAKAGIQAYNAKTDAEAESAWQSIGSNGTALGLSLVAAKSVAKSYNPDGNYSGVRGTVRALGDLGKEALAPGKEAWLAAKAGYQAGGLTQAANTLRTNVTGQFGEFTTTVRGNFNRIVFGTQSNIKDESKALSEQEQRLQEQLDKTTEGTKQHEFLQKQLSDIQAKQQAMNEINQCSSWEEAHAKIENGRAELQAKQAELAKATDPALKADLGKEIAQMEKTLDTQQSVLNRRIGEVRAIDDRIASLEKKQNNIDWSKDGAGAKFDKYQTEISELQAARGNAIEMPEAPRGFDVKDFNEWTKEYNKLRADVARGEHVPPTTPEGIADLAKARADLAEFETVYNPMKADYARYQVVQPKTGAYYRQGASEVGREILNQFTIKSYQNPSAFRLTLSTAGRNDEIEQRLANMLPSEQRQQFFRLTAAQRHQIAQQALAA